MNRTSSLPDNVNLVRAWEDAVNAADGDRLARLTSENVTIVGPRGKAVGREILKQWPQRARLRTSSDRVFARGSAVVVSQRAEWRSDDGSVIGEAAIASRFAIEDGKISEYERHDWLEEALTAAGLELNDEIGKGQR